ncbi:MAG: phage terminase large subunit family protein [Thermoanaerobaculia bacterium]
MTRNTTADWLGTLSVDATAPGVAARPSTIQDFLEQDVDTENGRWSLTGYEPFGELLGILDRAVRRRETDSEITLLKAEQVGATTIGIGAALHLVADRQYNVGYFLPTDKFAHRFGRTRLKRMISRSPFLSSHLRDREVVSQATIKEFDGRFLYVLGLEAMLGAVSIPLDVLAYDEVDLLPEENLEWSRGRVARSPLRLAIYFSAGYTPGAGIDSKWQEGSQRRILFRCAHCRLRGICLEETFPECMAKLGGHWTRVCPRCRRELDLSRGEWVATFPNREKSRRYSFRLSALAVGSMPGDAIWHRWQRAQRKKSEMAKFRCSVLAIPDAGAMQPVSDAELAAMRSSECVLSGARGFLPRYGGMDTGDLCHLWVDERLPDGRKRLVWIEEIDSDRAVERVSEIIDRIGITQLVIDKKPLTTVARALAYRFPRTVVLQDFTDSSEQKLVEEQHESRTYRCVKVNRDESLDDFTAEITGPLGLILPAKESEVLSTLSQHLKNLRKERVIDAKGRAVDRYVKGVANHFGMAGNSARIAELVAPAFMPFEIVTPRGAQVPAWGQSRDGWGAYRG